MALSTEQGRGFLGRFKFRTPLDHFPKHSLERELSQSEKFTNEIKRILQKGLKPGKEYPLAWADYHDTVMRTKIQGREAGILEHDVYSVLNGEFGRDENNFSWIPGNERKFHIEEVGTVRDSATIHASITNPDIVFVTHQTYKDYSKERVAVGIFVRKRTEEDNQLLAAPVRQFMLDPEFAHPFTPV